MARLAPRAGIVIAGIVLAALMAAGVIELLGRLTATSPSAHARTAVQTLFVNPTTSRPTARVQSCGQIGSNIEARIYMCQVVATTCSRFFQFAVYRDPVYGATPVFAPSFALIHPCTPIHT